MTRARTIDELIERSSLGTNGAVELRRRTPERVARGLVRRSSERGTELRQHRRGNQQTLEGRAIVENNRNRHVVPNRAGGWDVRKSGGSRASSHHETQSEAERRAREIVRNLGGGEVRTYGRNGRIRNANTVPKNPTVPRYSPLRPTGLKEDK